MPILNEFGKSSNAMKQNNHPLGKKGITLSPTIQHLAEIEGLERGGIVPFFLVYS